jgi:uncharacterized protein YjbI with pentapeptide repeats
VSNVVDLSNSCIRGTNLYQTYGPQETDRGSGILYSGGANLGLMDLSGADVTNADLTSADLRGADLTGAIYEQTVVKDAITDTSTKGKWW